MGARKPAVTNQAQARQHAAGSTPDAGPPAQREAQSFPDLLLAVRAPGSAHLDPAQIAAWLELPLKDLADLAGVHRNTVRLHPEAPRLQVFLLDLVRVLSAVARCQGGVDGAAFNVKRTPIPRFRHKTLLELVAEGRVEEALDYVDSVLPGLLWERT